MFTGPSDNTAIFMLHQNGTYDIDDVPIGDNKVTVDTEAYKPELGSRYVKVPAKYLQPETTSLTFKVEGGNNTANFDLQ